MDLTAAWALARAAHEGQVDKAGTPYIYHVQRVMALLTNPDEKFVAALHDIVEDTATTLDDLATAGCPPHIVAAVDSLTKREDEDYVAFIRRAASNQLARAVKAADLCDNSDEDRLARLSDTVAAELRTKYARAIEVLGAAAQIHQWREGRRAAGLLSTAIVTGDPDAMSALITSTELDVRFACSDCDESAARLILVHEHLVRLGFFGIASFDLSGPGVLETVRAAIRARDLATLRLTNIEFAPFWCAQCERVLCQAHWTTAVTFDDGFYDATYGTCPAGHRQLLDD
jgi:hypothetical protein